MSELLDNAYLKVADQVRLFDGRIYKAFDDVGTGLCASELADWFHGRHRGVFHSETGKVFGACLTVAMMAVVADRRTHRDNPTIPDGEWARSEEWERRVHKSADTTGVPVEHRPQGWVKAPLQALLGREPAGGEETPRWHLSVAHEDRIPTWEELVDAAHALRPGVAFCMGLPPRSWWLNYDERVLHLWEIRDAHLIDQWRAFAGRGVTPT